MSRAARRNLCTLALTLLLLKSTWFSASAVIPQLRAEWGLSAGAAGWLTICVQWGFVAGALVSAATSLPDRMAPVRLIFVSALGAAAANAALLAADGVVVASMVRFATGFFIAGVYPPALKLVATWYRTGLGAAMGLLVGALTVSSGAPHLVNGLGGLDWHTVIWATSVLTALGGTIVVVAVREGPYPFPRARLESRLVGRLLADRGTRLAVVGYLCHMWELYAMWSWFLLFYSAALRPRGLDDSALAAYVTFAVFVAGGAGNYVGGVLGDRFGRERAAIWMMAGSAACAMLIGSLLHAPPWVLALAGLLWGFTVVADSPQFSALVTELADQRLVGSALTVQMACGFTLTGVTIWLVPAAADAVGWQWAFTVLAPGPLCGIVAMRLLTRHRGAPPPPPGRGAAGVGT
ncbi:MFS transporter [Actinomadura sp. NPDC047616]|uniref:MFS transporter n=1 Tax=Actinomadura sp. NPDC047616 TaxID=3155914 RepID=UPI0033D76764